MSDNFNLREFETGCLLLKRPICEVLWEVSTKFKKERKKIVKKLSNEYAENYIECLNETFNVDYKKTVFYPSDKNPSFSITIYSKYKLSKELVYMISEAYLYASQKFRIAPRRRFLDYLDLFYREFESITDIKNRITLYEHVENGLIIILDVVPETLGFNSEIMHYTKLFNSKQDNGKFKTIIMVYIDIDIIAISINPLSLSEVKSIIRSYRKSQCCMIRGEGAVEYGDFIDNLNNVELSNKIKSYDHYSTYLTIEID